MALATRCPHCETVFKLDPHLLAPHDGRVRCGHCQEIFDAAHHRFELPDETAAPAMPQHAAIIDDEAAIGPATRTAPADTPPVADTPPKRRPFAPSPAAPAAPLSTPEDDEDRTVYAHGPASPPTSAPAPQDDATQTASSDAANEPSAEPQAPPRVKQFVRAGAPQTRPDAPFASPVEPPPPPFRPASSSFSPVDDRAEPFIGPVGKPSEPPPPRPAPEATATRAWADDPEPGFGERRAGATHAASANEAFPAMRETMHDTLHDAPRPPATEPAGSTRKGKGGRIAGIVLAVLLVLLLAAQLAWWQRETVMVSVPGAHALYADVCDQLGCKVSPPRDIDGLQIESSGLRQVDGPHKLELKLSLRNRMDVALAYPALELTLLDDKNNVAIRRVLWPQDYARPGTIFAIGLPPQSAQPVVIRLDTGDAVAANYRVQVFYP
ncbi:DUF3426 domain-containing protein [Caballeronia sp. LZ065]|uniref:zinc-ribbon and DUF3426 domain-containing protein n=1 Tax=Caballeronia sp. LZ065 TaxID=3038571 RepID=UPI00285F209A|nr:DUF3426 domain-containing protein [Caballeronia sp. LZ065]MDR5780342.1 DUF3426 domain-containing protein [Caballeronia sp. LZ065]